jgi:tetratricopeptide (TPR) repeat protein
MIPSIPKKGRTRACVFAAAVSLLVASCLAPTGEPKKHPVEKPEPEVPYESIAASVSVGNPQAALDEYSKALKEKPQSRLTRLLHARLLIVAGKIDEAREELAILLAEDDGDAGVLYSLSVIEGLTGDRKGQEEYLRKAIAADPANSDALSALGDIALERKDRSTAGSYFDRALAQDPNNLVALLGRGELLTQEKEYAKASATYTKAIEAQPDYPFAYIDRARSRKYLGDAEGGIQDLSKAIRLDPEFSWSYIDRGKLYVQARQPVLALEDFSTAIELAPESFAGYALRAETLYQMSRYDDALPDYRRALSIRADYFFAYEPLGVISYTKSDWSGARRYFADAYRSMEEEHSLALLAALSSVRAGKPKDAADYLLGVLPRIPRETWYYEVARFLVDPSMDARLLSRIQKEKNPALRSRMLFYVAEQYLAAGRLPAARSYLLEADGKSAPGLAETRLALWELDSMKPKE